jgi:hypothetical protein
LEEHSISSYGGEAQYLLEKAIDEKLWDSAPITMIRWLSPLLLVLIFGGVIYGSYRFEAIRELADKTQEDINNAYHNVQQAVTTSENKIETLKENALQEWNKKLNEAADLTVNSFHKEIEIVKAGTTEKIKDSSNE